MKTINKEIPSVYNPKVVEEKWYKFWLEKIILKHKINLLIKKIIILSSYHHLM